MPVYVDLREPYEARSCGVCAGNKHRIPNFDVKSFSGDAYDWSEFWLAFLNWFIDNPALSNSEPFR